MFIVDQDVLELFETVGNKYDGSIIVSMQSKLNNSSVNLRMLKPRIKRSMVGIWFEDSNNEACLSYLDVDSSEIVNFSESVKCVRVFYKNSALYMTIIFEDRTA